MLWTQFYGIRCNACQGHYYIDAGDPSDCTGFTPETVKCPWCGAVEQIGDECEFEEGEGEQDDYAELGKKSLSASPPPKKEAKS